MINLMQLALRHRLPLSGCPAGACESPCPCRPEERPFPSELKSRGGPELRIPCGREGPEPAAGCV